MRKNAAIILAAGKGVRMKSPLPKALCRVLGKPMVEFMLDSALAAGIDNICVVGGYKIELLKKSMSGRDIRIVKQKRLLGSADAVKQASPVFKSFRGTILVLYADTPLVKSSTIKKILKKHASSKADLTLLSVKVNDSKEYGRIMRDEKGKIRGIIEHADIAAKNKQQKTKNTEINVGAYCFNSTKLFKGLNSIKKNKKKNEYYLTDIIAHFYNKGHKISSYITKDPCEALGVNRISDLQQAEGILQNRIIRRLSGSGVIIKDTRNAYIEEDVKIGRGTVIYPFVVIERGSVIGPGCKVGPFAHLRKGAVLKKGSCAGNYVEVVRSILGEGSRAKHHSYIGDTLIGKYVNVGAGTITANYDGKNKNKTVINDRAFIGSGTTIVAPVSIGKKAVTGAGSVVVKGRDVAPKSVVVGVPARPLLRKKKRLSIKD